MTLCPQYNAQPARVMVLLGMMTALCSSFGFRLNSGRFCKHNIPVRNRLMANPITSDGSKFGREISEENAFQWFDEALVYVRGGSGGFGSSAHKFGKSRQHVKPTGGNGGDGGNRKAMVLFICSRLLNVSGSVIFEADSSFNTLLRFRGRKSFAAITGENGGPDFATGAKGGDIVVPVPKGLVVKYNSTGEFFGELTVDGQRLVVANGGIGGKGNAALRTQIEKGGSTPPQGGEKRWLKLELKLMADIGLVGMPNAGKSTLLDALTNAKPKIANYAFTTIVPNLGVCEVGGAVQEGGEGVTIADIPGLIEGAHLGVGLGRGFLRHVERCQILIHVVDGCSIDPVRDFLKVNNELVLFSRSLASKPQIVVLNKIDELEVGRAEAVMTALREVLPHSRLLAISAKARLGLTDLMGRSYSFLKKVRKDERSDSS